MLKIVIPALVAWSVAILGGALSVWYAVGSDERSGAASAAGWTSLPELATDSSEPYAAARAAVSGRLGLGSAEGQVLVAERDAAGELLRLKCEYRVGGAFPPARLWTLHAASSDLALVASGRRRPAALHSQAVLRGADNSVQVTVAAQARSGNWLPVSGAGPMKLVLSLYDSPVAAAQSVDASQLPTIEPVGCHA